MEKRLQSEAVDKLFEALAKAQAEYPPIQKTKTAKVKMKAGGEYSYAYADYSNILSAINPILAKNGLSITQRTTMDDKGLILESVLGHASGQWSLSQLPIPFMNDPQELGSFITYYRRYQYCCQAGVQAEDDDDGNAAKQGQTANASARTQRAKPTQQVVGQPKQGVTPQASATKPAAIVSTQPAPQVQAEPKPEPLQEGVVLMQGPYLNRPFSGLTKMACDQLMRQLTEFANEKKIAVEHLALDQGRVGMSFRGIRARIAELNSVPEPDGAFANFNG